MRNIEVGGAVFSLGGVAILRLGGIDNKVLKIAGIVERFGPNVVDRRRNALPTIYSVAYLEGVVVRFAGRFLLEYVEGSIRASDEGAGHAEIVDAVATVIGSVDGGLAGLTYVVKAEESMALRSNVANLQSGLTRQL